MKHSRKVVCGPIEEEMFAVIHGRETRVDSTMTEFAQNYMAHQSYTGHLAVMVAMLVRMKMHFGREILDIGCGTGDPLRGFIRNVMMPEYVASQQLRGPTRILSIDSNEAMLIRCEAEFRGLKQARSECLQLLDMVFHKGDVMELDASTLAASGFKSPDTLLASYVIYWANDKIGTMRRFFDLLAPGGKLVTVEESPLAISPSPFMPAELAESIKTHIRVIPLPEYYAMLRSVGFEEVPTGEKKYEIDDDHAMYGKVFQKPGKD